MSLSALLSLFAHDKQLQLVLGLIAADFLFGVLAAFKTKTFNLAYVAAFAHDDLLGKVAPWFALFALGKAAGGGVDLGVGTISFATLSDSVFVAVTGAMGASIFSSLKELGVTIPVPFSGPTKTPAPAPPA